MMGKFSASFWIFFAVLLGACTVESEIVEETTPLETTVTIELPTSTLVPPTDMPVKPTATSANPTSCKEVEGTCLSLTFDGDSCKYDGFTEPAAVPVKLFFYNESDAYAAVVLLRHTGDETGQDMIDYMGEEPSKKHAPSWTKILLERGIPSGRSLSWDNSLEHVDLESGIYTLACVKTSPHRAWIGAVVTVED
jgi:hypothetical protein